MKNLKLLSLLALTVLFLFLGGCQKDAEDSSVKQIKLSPTGLIANKIYSYSPVFNSRVESFVGKGRSVLSGFSSPDTDTIKHVLKQIELQDSIHPFLYKIYNNNYSFDINYAILANKHDLGFEVHVPIFSANTLKGLLIYKELDNRWWISIIAYKEIQDLLQNQNISDEKIVQYYPYIVSINAINYRKFHFASKELDNWLSINFRKLNLTPGGSRLCYAVGYWIEYGYIWVGPNGACGGLCVAQYISYQVCTDPELEPPCCGDGSIPLGNYGDSGGNSGWGSVNSSDINEIIKLFPELADKDCLEKYANSESLQYLRNLISNNVNNNCIKYKIAQSFSDLCNTARENTPLENGNGNWVDLIDNNGNIFGTAFGGGTSGQFGPQDIGLSYKEIEDEIDRLKRESRDPCTGEPVDIDYNKIKEALCNKNKLNLDDFKNEVDASLLGVDNLKIDPTFSNCKALNCIYQKLYNNGSKMFCNNIYRFNYSDNIDLTIRVGTTFGNAEGTVSMSKSANGVVMTFAKFNCEWDDHIQLAETILHESVHAKFRFDHANNGTTEAEFINNFLKFVNEKYGIPYTEHQLMIENYMEKLADELRILNGNRYDKSYYMAWVWDGLKEYWPNKFSDAKIKDWDDKRKIVKANNPFKC